MRAPALLRRKEIWLPTPFGALVLLLICASALVLAGRHAYAFLAPNEPQNARVLVVEGWMPRSALGQALELWKSGRFERIVTTGGPIESEFGPLTASTYAERARLWLEEHGVPSGRVAAVPGPGPDRERTYRTALAVRQWLAHAAPDVDAVDVLSFAAHTRRSWLLYRMALRGRARVGILAASPLDYDPARWWATSAGTKNVVEEAIAFTWTELFFWPDAPAAP